MGVRNTINWMFARNAVVQTGEDVMRSAAHFMAETAQANAPVLTGQYKAGIGVEERLGDDDGIVSSCVATAPHSAVLEYGHYTTTGLFVPPNPIMRQALAATIQHFPSIAGRHKLTGGGRSVGSTGGGGYRNVTFASAGDFATEVEAGSASGVGGGRVGVTFGK